MKKKIIKTIIVILVGTIIITISYPLAHFFYKDSYNVIDTIKMSFFEDVILTTIAGISYMTGPFAGFFLGLIQRLCEIYFGYSMTVGFFMSIILNTIFVIKYEKMKLKAAAI